MASGSALSASRLIARAVLVVLGGLAALWCIAADPPPVSADGWSCQPGVIRFDLAAGASATRSLEVLAGARDLTVLAVESECPCIRVVTPMPLRIPANGAADLVVQTVGVQDGFKPLLVRTTRGQAMVSVHLVVNGSGTGLDALRRVASHTRELRAATVAFLLHDLRGKVRNCGCNAGSLGGADRLAALPETWALHSRVPAQWWMDGDIDGHRQGVAGALAAQGWQWRPATAAVRITADPRAPSRADLVPSPGAGGVAVWAVALDGRGRPVGSWLVPIDQSLPAVPGWLVPWAEPVIAPAPDVGDPSASCLPCHAQAVTIWHASAHAKAWAGLPEADRTASCIACHSEPSPTGPIPAVTCQSCHPGALAHAASGGMQRVHQSVDCRMCHDAQHHPGFHRESEWLQIRH